MLHWSAWERGLKSLYYLRSKSVQRAAFAGAEDKPELQDGAEIDPNQPDLFSVARIDYDECLACQ
ncbi:ribonucleotide-diphosphate reductase subunit alpha [compost metagenome]